MYDTNKQTNKQTDRQTDRYKTFKLHFCTLIWLFYFKVNITTTKYENQRGATEAFEQTMSCIALNGFFSLLFQISNGSSIQLPWWWIYLLGWITQIHRKHTKIHFNRYKNYKCTHTNVVQQKQFLRDRFFFITMDFSSRIPEIHSLGE